jgi:hypothetical protein
MSTKEQPDFRASDFELRLWDQIHHGGNVTVLRSGPHCTQCRKRIPDDGVVGPINVVIRDPEMIGPEGIEREFCSWECAADWFEVQAGRRAPNSVGAPF